VCFLTFVMRSKHTTTLVFPIVMTPLNMVHSEISFVLNLCIDIIG
jgi:hypothetical protein